MLAIGIIAGSSLRYCRDIQIKIHLRTLSDGKRHPAANCPTIHYSPKLAGVTHEPFSTSITSFRLAVLANYLIIWDWKSGRVLFVRQPLGNLTKCAQAVMQELEEERYFTMEFIDDYRLLVSLASTVDAPSSVVVMDTGKDVGGSPIQTIFHLPPHFINSGGLSFLLEPGAHNPSPAESLAPFNQDSAQRIVVLNSLYVSQYLVLRVEALLGFHENREGSTVAWDVAWDEWKSHVVIPIINNEDVLSVWVSGCRLFLIFVVDDDYNDFMTMFDFSAWGRVRYLREGREEFGIVRYLMPTGAVQYIPWDLVSDVQSGHDSIVLFRVSVAADFSLREYHLT